VLNCALFRGSQRGLRVPLANGLQVRASGVLTSYPPRSNYQLIVRAVEAAGKGSLQEQFEKLKARLAAEGLFAAERKRPMPMLPQRIGIVTSLTGAAIRDMLSVLGRRFPNLHVLIAPVRVQGEGAAEEIAAALDLFRQRDDLDVLIVGRGGGSMEDLWAFNEEVVARAIARARVPVISAVGHEVDFTISDFVADLRAPTPSAAAELDIRPKADFEQAIADQQRRLVQNLRSHTLGWRNRFTRAAGSYVFREPGHLLGHYRQRVDALGQAMQTQLQRAFRDRQQRVDEAQLRLVHRVQLIAQASTADVQRLAAHLRALSPLAVLDRGYSITRAGTRVVRGPADVQPGDRLETRLAEGKVFSVVERTEEKSHGG
jgi:exodeoxyribonuclease VII large subunit